MNKKSYVFFAGLFSISLCMLGAAYGQTASNLPDARDVTIQKNAEELQKSLQRLQAAANIEQNQTPQTALNAAPPSEIPSSQAQLAPPSPSQQATTQQPTQATAPTQTTAQTTETKKTPDPYESAFNQVINRMVPMTPEQINRLRAAFTAAQRSAATPAGTPPKPTSSSIQINLSPKATPPIIRLEGGYISSLVFMDATGQPWPIASYSIGDSSAFNIQWNKKSNTLLVQATSYYKRTNIAVILKGLDTPVMLTLVTGQSAVDYRVDLHVPGLGPNAAFTQKGSLPHSANPVLLNVLNDVPPTGSKTLKVRGCSDCQAWLSGKTMYLRTHLDIISPAWKSIMSSMDGTHAYELQPSPVVLAVEHGKDQTITLTLEGWE